MGVLIVVAWFDEGGEVIGREGITERQMGMLEWMKRFVHTPTEVVSL